jgi:Phosphotransferase enzyme family
VCCRDQRSKEHVTKTEEAIAVIGALLRDYPEQIHRLDPAVGGDGSYSFRFSVGGRSLLLKAQKRPGVPIGIYFHERIREAGVPVPELVSHSPDAGPQGQACAIWSWVEGRPADWGMDEACPYDEAEFGELLRQIHELRFDGAFGLLGDDISRRTFASHPDLGPTSDTWTGFFHCDRAARRYAAMGYLNEAEARTLAGLPARMRPQFANVQARLLHMGDIMHQGNMLIGLGGHIQAVVDFVESTAGDPRWELAWIDYYFSMLPHGRLSFDTSRFRAAYGTDHDPYDEIGRFYLLAILLFEKLLFYRPDSERGKWAIGTVKSLLMGFQ